MRQASVEGARGQLAGACAPWGRDPVGWHAAPIRGGHIDSIYLHLALNHVPVVGVILCAAFFLAAWFRRSADIQVMTSFALIAIALVTIAVYLSGDKSEHRVEELPGVSESFLEEHEDTGFNAMVLVELLGTLALVNLLVYRARRTTPRPLGALLLLLALVTSGVLIWTANLGGQIRHSEIRSGSLTLGDFE